MSGGERLRGLVVNEKEQFRDDKGLFNHNMCFFAKFCCKFPNFLLLKLLSTKNAEKDYFDQRLECAVPKRWSKYTTTPEKDFQYYYTSI